MESVYWQNREIDIILAKYNLPWLKIALDGVPELILDNIMLQTFRMCEARFVEEYINGWSSKGSFWFLDLGIIVHKCIEEYYINRRKHGFDIIQWSMVKPREYWTKMDMDAKYNTHPEYIKLGGVIGLAALLLQYAQYFNLENERFRVIGAELYFGRGKEVPLLEDHTTYSFAPFRFYLSGKLDLLVDDGSNIGPMDHKTARDFRGQNPIVNYEIQEGMTGYVYAGRSILRKLQLEIPESKRNCNKIWMNFLQIKPEKEMSARFRRMPLFKTDWDLEQYRLRQISTAARIFQLLINPDMKPFYNTMACTNYMHNTCAFNSVHRQNSESNQLLTLESLFVKKPIWDPENRDEL